MLRISAARSAGSPAVQLRLEGQVVGRWVEELRQACAAFLTPAGAPEAPLVLDLSEVSFVDADGVALLRDLIRREVSLGPCSPFVRAQLEEVQDVAR